MSDSFRQAAGRKIISRASAENLGAASSLLVDPEQRRITAVIVGRGRKARVVEWEHVSGFGPDAIMVVDEGALRPPAGDREKAAADGRLALLATRALTESGNQLGSVDDVAFDADTGFLEMLEVDDRQIPAGALLGLGSYAAVLDRSQERPQ